MNPKKISPLIFFFVLLLAGCDIDEPEMVDPADRVGFRPVYGVAETSEITLVDAKPVKNPGKIYVYGRYLLVNELKEGIHVFDNADPSSPVAAGFIQLLGNTDMAIKDGTLYADHMGNLVALSTDDFTNITEKGRLSLANWNLGVPPPASHYFECVDPSKGLVVAWKKTQAQNLKCYAIQ